MDGFRRVNGPNVVDSIRRVAGQKRLNPYTTGGTQFSVNRLQRYWPLYFPHHDIENASDSCINDIEKFVDYMNDYPQAFLMKTATSCLFDYPTLASANPVDEFPTRIKNEPEYLISCMGLAVCYFISSTYGARAECIVGDRKVRVSLLHHEPVTHMKSLKSSFVGKLVTVRGTVVRTSPIKPLLMQAQFNCARCEAPQIVQIVDGKYEAPSKCQSQGCRSKIFEIERGVSPSTRTVDWQQIRIQEKINDDRRDPGRVPRTIDAELLGDLVESVVPGDVVDCTGVIKVMQSDEGKGRGRPNSLYILYIEAVSVNKIGGGSAEGARSSESSTLSSSGPSQDDETETKDGIHFSRSDLMFIREAYKQPKLFRLLVHSFSPGIFGHEIVKAGIILALFGSRKRVGATSGGIDIRSDSHVLVVGDPGLGKSQMLSAVGQVAPRGVYVCGTSGISNSGLTVTLVKEAGSGDFALEAGALVLSDMGCCSIDEFDKVKSEHSSLLEAMEQQSISIAKGGMVCSLPARASVIAAANPAGGHYNKAKTVAENLKINSALLSRFDLIFILLDRPDTDMDRFLSEHVMSLHSGTNNPQAQYSGQINEQDENPIDSGQPEGLERRLRLHPREKLDVIPPPLLRKYIAYARKYVHPRLSSAAVAKIKEFYLELRTNHRKVDSTPITTRQLEALVRLAEARARAELREVVTERDACDVIDIMKYSLFQTYEDENGIMDFARSQMGTGISRTSDIKRFVSILHRTSEETFNNLFTYTMMLKIATDMKLRFGNFQDIVDKLNHEGYLLKKGPNTYQLTTM